MPGLASKAKRGSSCLPAVRAPLAALAALTGIAAALAAPRSVRAAPGAASTAAPRATRPRDRPAARPRDRPAARPRDRPAARPRDRPAARPGSKARQPGARPSARRAAGAAADPAQVPLRFAEARLAADAGDRKAVIRLCTAVLKADPGHLGARHLRGVTYVAEGRWAEAERDLMRVASRRPRDAALQHLLARALLAQKKWMWAARRYRRVLQLQPKNGELWLAYGYALYKLGEKELAREALAKTRKHGDAAAANAARVLEAILLQQQGKLRSARRLAGEVRGPARGAAERLTRLIYGAEGRAARGLDLSFTVGSGYDSNVSMDPADARGSGSMGWMFQLGGGLRWRAFTWGRHRVGVDAALHRTFAVNFWDEGGCVPDYSTLVGAVTPYYAVRFATGRVDHELRLAYRGQVITLDGDCTDEGSLYVFSESHQGALDWELRWTDRWATHLSLDLGYDLYHQQVRDQLAMAFQMGQELYFFGRRMKLYPLLRVSYGHARGDWWTAVSVRPGIAVSALLPGKVDLVGVVSGEVSHHPDSADYYLWQADDHRTDWILRLRLSVGRAFTSWLRGDLSYRYRLNHSNARVWDYQRHELGFTLTATVGLLGGDADAKKAQPPRRTSPREPPRRDP